MKLIQITNPHTKKHFDFFNGMAQPHFNITSNVDISVFFDFIKKEGLPFTPMMVYVISRCANEIIEFRWRIRNDQIVEHENVHPSFTVKTDFSKTFSFCYVDYQKDLKLFVKSAIENMEKMKKEPSFEDEPGRDDLLFLSAIPWVSFTGFQHAMRGGNADSVPRIVWGKFFEQDGKKLMPLSVSAHHAIVDGQQVGEYFIAIQKLLNEIGDLV